MPASAWIAVEPICISPRDWEFSRLGFPDAPPAVRRHLESIIAAFVEGYQATLEDSRPEVLMPRLRKLSPFLGACSRWENG